MADNAEQHRAKYHKGEAVCWNWGSARAYGEVEDIYTERTSLVINGRQVTRNATSEEPAYRLLQEDGQVVLKSESELHPVPLP